MSYELAKEWLRASQLDLENIGYIIKVEHLTSIIAFHSQQSVEKTLKALLVSKKLPIPRVHSLNKLFSLCATDIKNDNFDLVQLLDSLYIESRYPGEMGLLPYGQPTLEDAKEFYTFANELFEKVRNQLNIPIEEIKAK